MEEKIYSITNICRNILINFLKKFDQKDYEYIIEDLLVSDIYDNILMDINKSVITVTNINYFKYIIFKIILSDCYLFIEKKSIHDKEIDLTFDIDFNNEDEIDDDEFDKDLDSSYQNNGIENQIYVNILKYLEKSIINHSFFEKKDYKIRLNIYSLFIIYNLYNINKKQEIKFLKDNIETSYVLKKLNPFYILDLIECDSYN